MVFPKICFVIFQTKSRSFNIVFLLKIGLRKKKGAMKGPGAGDVFTMIKIKTCA